MQKRKVRMDRKETSVIALSKWAELKGISNSTAKNWAQNKKIAAWKSGRDWLIEADALTPYETDEVLHMAYNEPIPFDYSGLEFKWDSLSIEDVSTNASIKHKNDDRMIKREGIPCKRIRGEYKGVIVEFDGYTNKEDAEGNNTAYCYTRVRLLMLYMPITFYADVEKFHHEDILNLMIPAIKKLSELKSI